MKIKILLSILIMVSLFGSLTNFIGAEMLVSDAGVEYDSEIIDQFNKIKNNESNETFVSVLFYLKDSLDADKLISIFSNEEFKLEVHRDNSSSIIASITKPAFDKLIQDDRIDQIHYNFPVQLFLKDSAPLINATYTWDTLGYTGYGVKVCVIDSGIDTDQIELKNTIAAQKCYNSDNHCPNNQNNDTSAEDGFGHGTRVASVIASQDRT